MFWDVKGSAVSLKAGVRLNADVVPGVAAYSAIRQGTSPIQVSGMTWHGGFDTALRGAESLARAWMAEVAYMSCDDNLVA